jgi:DNA invertase Pin-like site-specific DNA recombinase
LKRTRAVAYIRVSSDKQKEQGLSLEAQVASIRAYAGLYQIDLVLVPLEGAEGPPRPFLEDDITAKNMDRPGLQRVLAMLKSGEADAVIVTKLDRLTRSVRDLSFLLEEHFAEGGSQLFSVSEQIDTRTAGGRLVLNILASVSQWEREVIGERTKAVMQHMKREGLYTGGRAPYGRKLEGQTLVANDLEQLTIASARELRRSGLSLRAIGRALIRHGIHPRSGGEWNAMAVKRLVAA